MRLRRSLYRVAALLIVPTLLAAAQRSPARAVSPVASHPHDATARVADTGSEGVIVRANAERRTHNLPDLASSASLMRAAKLQADQMAAARTLSHHIRGARYPALLNRLSAVGYHWRATSENVGSGYADAESLLHAWKNAHGHHTNIVSPRFTEAGAGVATDSDGVRYWVLVFGTPR